MHVLIADDDPLLRLVLANLVHQEGHAVVQVTDGDEALAALAADPSIDLCLLDWNMPRLSGLEACKRARLMQRTRPLYVLLLTGRADPEDLVGGLDAGADEYLVKPYRPEELKARLRAAQRTLSSLEAARAADARAAWASTHDVGTGVLNRRAIIDHLRAHGDASVLRIDIDGFRALNEKHGLAAGDMVLREVARRISEQLPAATVGRTGSDDFLAALEGVDGSHLRSLARKVVTAVRAEPIGIQRGEVDVTVSIDIVPPQPSVDVERLLASAEAVGRGSRGGEGGRVNMIALDATRA